MAAAASPRALGGTPRPATLASAFSLGHTSYGTEVCGAWRRAQRKWARVHGALLKEDDDLLRHTFLSVFRHHHPRLADKLAIIFALSQAWCMSEADADFEMLEQRLAALAPNERILVASAFSHLLDLHNITEDSISARVEQAGRIGEVEQATRSTNKSVKASPGTRALDSDDGVATLWASPQPSAPPSVNWAFAASPRIAQIPCPPPQRLVRELGVEPEAIYAALCRQSVGLVFTAHPTQATRQTLLKKHSIIRAEMDRLHNMRLSPYERLETLEEIRSQAGAHHCMQSFFLLLYTNDFCIAPSFADESRQGLTYFHETLFRRAPILWPTDELTAGLAVVAARAEGFEACWGAPTGCGLPVFLRRIDTALKNIGQPMLPLDNTLFTFGAWPGGDRDGNPNVTPATTRTVVLGARLRYLRPRENVYDVVYMSINEPFRLVLSEVRALLQHTRDVLYGLLDHPETSVKDALAYDPMACSDVAELLGPLRLCYDSLLSTGDDSVANSRLLDARTFGLALCRLDIRQESSRHTDALDAITTFLGLGSYKEWDEEQRMAFLVAELSGNRPLLPRRLPMSPEVADVIDTFRMLATLPQDSLGGYIISMAHTASDVLAVLLLQRECGVEPALRVVPLFETLDDLEYAETAMRRLLSTPWYLEQIAGQREVMIGYSDSGKDAGRLAAAWSLYEVQETLTKLAKEHGVHLTLFHGRGGTVGRGGAPAHLAVLSQPPGTIEGSIRVTVQGEVVEQQFGEREMCFRTLDLYTGAVLEATLAPMAPPLKVWREAMARMAAASCKAYRAVVKEDPRFPAFFTSLTPVNELGRMNIGSRPAKRNANALRHIVRFHLPVWLGIGEALHEMGMYDSWMFFRVVIDMLEMVLAKADTRVVRMYAKVYSLAILRAIEAGTSPQQLAAQHPEPVEDGSEGGIMTRSPRVAAAAAAACDAGSSPRRGLAGQGGVPGGAVNDLRLPGLAAEAGKHPIVSATEDALIISMKGIAAGMRNTG
eukprot:scaffold1.g5836.t1